MPIRAVRIWSVLLTLSVVGPGCAGGAFSAGGGAELTSAAHEHRLNAKLTTIVYEPSRDGGAVDYYLSDLPPEVWRRGGDVSGHSGNLIHIHLFIAPRAGSTPIATAASSATVRWLVLARGSVGVYGGGGFCRESGDPGDRSLGGSIREASLRLLRLSPGFEDRLGAGQMSASFSARLDPAEAGLMARALSALTAQAGEAAHAPTVEEAH
jgi:hypothetical protein